MDNSDVSTYRTFVKTVDGTLWSTGLPLAELETMMEQFGGENAEGLTSALVEVRGPLYSEGWTRRAWKVPLWSIVAISEKP